jgi:hypothetical protein
VVESGGGGGSVGLVQNVWVDGRMSSLGGVGVVLAGRSVFGVVFMVWRPWSQSSRRLRKGSTLLRLRDGHWKSRKAVVGLVRRLVRIQIFHKGAENLCRHAQSALRSPDPEAPVGRVVPIMQTTLSSKVLNVLQQVELGVLNLPVGEPRIIVDVTKEVYHALAVSDSLLAKFLGLDTPV